MTEREFMYNEILPPIIEKEKILEVNERLVYQLLKLFSKTSQNKPKSYPCTAKSHATLFPEKFIPLYLEYLRFLIKRCCWKGAKIYSHYTFEQLCFKRKLMLMNPRSRRNVRKCNQKEFFQTDEQR